MYHTRQEVFDAAVKGLASQGFERSMSKHIDTLTEVCAYRGEGGLKCSIGHLIPDEAYDPSIEGFGISLLVEKSSGQFSREVDYMFDFGEFDSHFLGRLQSAHDIGETPAKMVERLRMLAIDEGLMYPDEWNREVEK